MKKLKTGRARVIKISKEALFEFIYEKFIEEQSQLLEVEPTDVSDRFELNFADGDFIFAAWRDEDPEGNFLPMPGQIDLRKVMKIYRIPPRQCFLRSENSIGNIPLTVLGLKP
ncbi:MAG: hypothetical protein K5752_06650 [Succinivibrionaceae bacterium]|nr:hypothetical protein [Succinivibrionaceae bacterium]